MTEDEKELAQRIARVSMRRYDELKEREAEFRNWAESLLAQIQDDCPHLEVVQGRYSPSDSFSSAKPDFRVCKLCGYAEEGWGCGYWKLNCANDQVPTIDREAAWKLVKRFYYQSEIEARRHKARP